jgi:eukaryotic-like serine/threonine-protein kinase
MTWITMENRVVADRYQLVRQIGRGAMGFIWEAFDRHLRRRVAVKMMSPDHMSSNMARIRFDREAKAIAQLKNPHVVQIYDYGIEGDNSPFIVMELLEGEDLDSRVERDGRLPLNVVAQLVQQAASGLNHAHSKGIVHRDFKPANLFLAQSDSGETTKILDFGVVAMLSEAEVDSDDDGMGQTAAGTIVGTPLYMSPEQIRGGAVDNRSDLWSLGVVAYRALTGVNPFAGQWLGMLMVRICTDPFTPPSQVCPDLSPEVDAFFEKALAKDPDKRFRNAKEFGSAFMALTETRERRQARILVVDDEEDVELLVKQRFRQQIKKAIYEFVFAANGLKALEKLRADADIDVIMTDINMPGMDGLTFLSHIGEVNPHARTIVVSAYGDMGNIRTAMNRGAFDFVVKPIDFKDLEVTIEKTFKHVSELKRNAQSSEENNLLRMFISPTLIDRLHAKRIFIPVTSGMATVAYIDIARSRTQVTAANVEDMVRTLNANFEVIVPAVVGRGGVVEKFLGDSILVIFQGENHATRAIDACWTIRNQLRTLAARAGKESPFALGIRIGIATGTIGSGEVGSKAYGRLGHAILGDVPRAAATLEYSAKTNQILIDDATNAAVQGVFECNVVEANMAAFGTAAHEVVRRIGAEAPVSKSSPSGASGISSISDDMPLSSSEPGGMTSDTIITHDGDIPEEIPPGAMASTADDPALKGRRNDQPPSSRF